MTERRNRGAMRIVIAVVAMIIMAVILFACAGDGRAAITEENLKKVEKGMTLADIQKILGPPTQVLGDINVGGHAIWLTKDHKHLINIGFKDGKVMMKEWKNSTK